MKKVLILNGSPQGKRGNCSLLIQSWQGLLKPLCRTRVVHLATEPYGNSLKKKITEADAVVWVTGTYWDSWGSPLQELLEKMTALEASPALMGKPAAVFVLMHSVGGKGVLSRLQGVLSTMGFLIPPMSGMVYSLVSDIALKSRSSHRKDFWQREDAEFIFSNLLKACEMKASWTLWPVDQKDPKRTWLK
ncbi:MAG: NAD(P)H-dependent oxidoreductase [Bdellovibrio sp.]